jgi:hypothetical protein
VLYRKKEENMVDNQPFPARSMVKMGGFIKCKKIASEGNERSLPYHLILYRKKKYGLAQKLIVNHYALS